MVHKINPSYVGVYVCALKWLFISNSLMVLGNQCFLKLNCFKFKPSSHTPGTWYNDTNFWRKLHVGTGGNFLEIKKKKRKKNDYYWSLFQVTCGLMMALPIIVQCRRTLSNAMAIGGSWRSGTALFDLALASPSIWPWRVMSVLWITIRIQI